MPTAACCRPLQNGLQVPSHRYASCSRRQPIDTVCAVDEATASRRRCQNTSKILPNTLKKHQRVSEAEARIEGKEEEGRQSLSNHLKEAVQVDISFPTPVLGDVDDIKILICFTSRSTNTSFLFLFLFLFLFPLLPSPLIDHAGLHRHWPWRTRIRQMLSRLTSQWVTAAPPL